MHNDIFHVNSAGFLTSDLRLPSAPAGYIWSDALWAITLEGSIALFRPLSMSLVYLQHQFLSKNWNDCHALQCDEFIRDKFLVPENEKTDLDDLERLIRLAQSGTFRFICILPTTKCPLSCGYCHQKTSPGGSRTMNSAELDQGLTKCFELCANHTGNIDILIYGGEPLVAFHLTQQILQKTLVEKSFAEHPARVTLTTSGYGLQKWQADLLFTYKVFVIISLDGQGLSNDSVRHPKKSGSSFAIAERAYHILKNRGCRVGLSVTMGTHNYEHFSSDIDQLLKHFQPTDIGLNSHLHWIGDQPNPYQLDNDQAFTAFIAGFESARNYGIYAEQPFRRLKPFAFRKPLVKDCSSPGERLVLAPGGLIGFCDSCYPDDQFFYKIDQFPHPQHPNYQQWSHLSSPEMPTCRECPLMTICGGACRYDAYKMSKSLDGVDPKRCEFEKRFFRWIIGELRRSIKIPDKGYYFPTDADRQTLFGNVKLLEENQPFTAGSLIEYRP